MATRRARAQVVAAARTVDPHGFPGPDGTHVVDAPSLFDDVAPVAADPCAHTVERKTETVWPDRPDDPRLTWTCEACGRIRGRC